MSQQEAQVRWVRRELPDRDHTRDIAAQAVARVGAEIGTELSSAAARSIALAVVDAIEHLVRLRGVDVALREADEAALALQQRVIAPLLDRTDPDALGGLAMHRMYLDGIEHVRAQQQQLLLHNTRTWLGIEMVPLETPEFVPLPARASLASARDRPAHRAGTA